MTDRELAARTIEVNTLELAARAHMTTAAGADERQIAQVTLRKAADLRRTLESWIVQRATRALRTDIETTGASVTRK